MTQGATPSGVASTRPARNPLDPRVAERVGLLQVRARVAAETVLSGHHRSRRHGASAVFVEHREYRPGDDPRRLDWRAYARTDRPTVKHFEQEAQLRATLVLDRSNSMHFADPGAAQPSKAEHAASLLAAMAFILMRQGDAFGLSLVDTGAERTHPPRSRPDHFQAVLEGLALASLPEGAPRLTNLAQALGQVVESAGRRGVVVLASDLLDLQTSPAPATGRGPAPAAAPWTAALAQLVRRGHEVFVFHTLTRMELELDGDEPARYLGLEGEEPLVADPSEVGPHYRERMRAFCEQAERAVTAAGGRYRLARTDEEPALVLGRMLALAPERRR